MILCISVLSIVISPFSFLILLIWFFSLCFLMSLGNGLSIFSSAHGTFSRIDHILGHKSRLDKFKKIEIIPSILSDHSGVKLDVNYRKKKKTIKNTNIWRLNNMLLNNKSWKKFKKRNKNIHRNKRKWKHNNPKPVGHCKSSPKGKVHSNTGIPQETRKKSNK